MENLTAAALIAAGALGLLATLLILRRQRKDREDVARESPFAASTEGSKRCPRCGMGNTASEARCISCGAPLPG